MSDRHIDHELRRVDDAFSTLRPGRELDERLDDLLDGRAAPPRPLLTRLAPAAIAALAVAVLVIAIGRDEPMVALAPPERAPIEAPPSTPVVHEPSSAPRTQVANVDARPLEESVRFIDVPLGRLEVRSPSVVEIRADGAVVTSGSARLLERGKAPRTLLEGHSIAWRAPDAAEGPRTAPTEARTKKVEIAPDEIEAALARARNEESRGAYAEAADLLGDLLARRPPARVADTLGYERAMLLARARNLPDACAVLADHARRFPSSENAVDVADARARFNCR